MAGRPVSRLLKGDRRLAWPRAGEVSYRVEFGGGAQVQFHSLPEHARDAVVDCAAELAGQPWDAIDPAPWRRSWLP